MTDYISAADAAKTLRKEIKTQLGLNSRQVSVRTETYSMGSSLNVTIKVLGVAKETVEAIAERHSSITRCAITGDILSGGNRYVHVEYAYGLFDEMKAAVELPVDHEDPRHVCGAIYCSRKGDFNDEFHFWSADDAYDSPDLRSCDGEAVARRHWAELVNAHQAAQSEVAA